MRRTVPYFVGLISLARLGCLFVSTIVFGSSLLMRPMKIPLSKCRLSPSIIYRYFEMARQTDVVAEGENIQQIDAEVKNKWRWDWLGTVVCGDTLKNHGIQKLKIAGKAYCRLCGGNPILYGKGGKKTLADHCRTSHHLEAYNAAQSNAHLSGNF